ncbi:unnamed protein product [Durusdinium trenchii]|uniref:Uncharacterized protein n=1 Tax=Durusdinium trenchii TaxID=1381693 RepID=A0ABP0NSU6_9DINO
MAERVPVPEWDAAAGQRPDPAEPVRTPGSASDGQRPHDQAAPGSSGLPTPNGGCLPPGGFARILADMRSQPQQGFVPPPMNQPLPTMNQAMPVMNPMGCAPMMPPNVGMMGMPMGPPTMPVPGFGCDPLMMPMGMGQLGAMMGPQQMMMPPAQQTAQMMMKKAVDGGIQMVIKEEEKVDHQSSLRLKEKGPKASSRIDGRAKVRRALQKGGGDPEPDGDEYEYYSEYSYEEENPEEETATDDPSVRPSTVKTESEPPASEDQPAPSRRRPGREESARPKAKARTAAKSRPRAQDDHRAEVPASSIGGAPSDGGSSAQTSVIRDLLRDQSKRSQDRGKASISQEKAKSYHHGSHGNLKTRPYKKPFRGDKSWKKKHGTHLAEVKSGEDQPRSSASTPKGVKEEASTLFTDMKDEPGKSSSDSLASHGVGSNTSRGDDAPGMHVNKVNWTFMVSRGTGWSLVGEYDSEASSVESSESEEPPAWKPPDLPPEAEVRKNKYKMRLKAILEALEKGEKEEEAVKKLKRYHKKASKRKKEETKDKEMSVNPEEILALLPNLSKEEKKTLLKELLREHEEEICRSLPSDLHRTQRPERRVRSEGYSSGPLPKTPELSAEAWGTPELWKLRERLIFDPYSMALLQEVLEKVAEEKPDSETDEEEPTELQEVGDESFVTAAASWQEMMEDEAISKWDELALPPGAFKEIMTTEINSSQEGSVYSNDTSSGNETTSGNETGDEACMEEVEESGSESSESEEEEWSRVEDTLVADSGSASDELLTKGQEEVVRYLQKKCDHSHEHWPIEGKFKGADGKWRSLSEWAGGYPVPLCHAIIDGAEDFLRARAAHKGTFVEDDGDEGAMSDGDLQAGEEAIEEEEKMTGLLKEEDEEPEEGQRHPVPMEPEESKRARLMMRGSRTVRNLLKDQVQRAAQMLRRRRALADARVPAAPSPKRRRALPSPPAGGDQMPLAAPEPLRPAAPLALPPPAREVRPEDVPVPMDEFDDEPNREEAVAPSDEDFQQLLRRQTTEERQRHLLDDLPISIRKRLHEDDDDTGVAPPNKRARVSQDLVTQVMLSTLVTEEEEKGITMYYKEAPKKKGEKVRSYVEKDGEIYEVCWSSRQRKLFEREWLAEMKDVLMSEVMLLRMKVKFGRAKAGSAGR